MPRIVRFHETGGPDVLRIEEMPSRMPGGNEVRIRVQAIGLNRAEAMFRAGRYLDAPAPPSLIGYEASGTIDAVGPGVTGFAVGDAVSTVPAFSMRDYGVYGEEAIVPARAVARYPDTLDAPQATSIWMQYLTAWGGLVDIAGIGRDDVVLIPAATSSVGIASIQIVRRQGAHPIALTRRSDKKKALLRAAPGVDVVATEEEDLVEAVRRLAAGRRVRVAFDPVGGPTVNKLAAALDPGGILFIYGALSPDPTPFPLMAALGKGLTMRGYTLFEINADDARLDAGKRYVLDALQDPAFRPVIARTFRLDQIVDAHRFLESNAQIGKIVVTV